MHVTKKACQIARVSEKLVFGKRGEDVFPYIPFYKALKEKKEIPETITRLYSNHISIAVILVLRKEECIGAFATLQYFNEQEQRQNELRSQLLKKGHYAKYSFDDVIGHSPNICRTKEVLKRMAVTESPVLIVGETGTGKELMAYSVHRASARAEGPFIAINVAAMPENLLESELFGYVDGAFTGARKGGKPGLFEFAHQGTLFLDEVEGMSASMQVKLLRVLQEREVMRVGGSNIVKVDVRIVAATNEFLEEKVEEGSFRRDLYYCLNALTVVLPPLRERGDDIFMLLEYFRDSLGGDFELAKETRTFLKEYAWPGNIRELQNAVEYFNYIGKPIIELQDLPPTMTKKLSRQILSENSEVSLYEGENSLTRFILEQIFLAGQHGYSVGRESLLQAARQRGFLVSQKKIRDLLLQMSEQGLIIRGRGRSGNRLIPKGFKQYNS